MNPNVLAELVNDIGIPAIAGRRQKRLMTASSLPAAIRAAAEGICTLEAATGLVIAHGTWLGRDDSDRFIDYGAGTAAIHERASFT